MAAPAGSPVPAPSSLIRVGEILGAHGVRGEVRLRSFAEVPSDIESYSPLVSADGAQSYVIEALRPLSSAPDLFVVRLAGVSDRDQADALKGTALHVGRERLLPALGDDEFLHADLVGCRVEAQDGRLIGEVVAVQNFGAGDLIEIALSGSRRTEFLPFAETFVPVVDLAGRRIVVSVDPASSK